MLHFQPISASIYNNGSTYIVLSGSKDPSKSFPCINSFNSQNSMRQELFLYPPVLPPFYPDKKNGRTESLSNSPNITHTTGSGGFAV